MRDLFFEKTVDAGKLTRELIAALGHVDSGGKIVGVSGPTPCTVHVDDSTTPDDEATIAAIVKMHDPTPPPDPVDTLIVQAGALPLNDKSLAQIDSTTTGVKDLAGAVALINSLAKQVAILQARIDRAGIS